MSGRKEGKKEGRKDLALKRVADDSRFSAQIELERSRFFA
jgi:hypothetical protein